MDFCHLIVTCLFSMRRLPFDNQKVKGNYAIFLKNITIFFKKPGMFLCKGRWNHPHQVGHFSFSIHPYILAKTHYQSIV